MPKQAHPQWETCSGVGTVCLDSAGPERDEGLMEEMICGIDATRDVQEVSISFSFYDTPVGERPTPLPTLTKIKKVFQGFSHPFF